MKPTFTRRIRGLWALLAVAVCLMPATSAGASGGEIAVLKASIRGVLCELSIHAACQGEEGSREASFRVIGSVESPVLWMYEGTHKRRACYRFSGTESETLQIDGKTFTADSGSLILEDERVYEIRASAIYVWKTSRGKIQEGFAPIFRRWVYAEPVRLTGAEIRRGAGDSLPGEEMVPEVTITGEVCHTGEWDENRDQYNSHAEGEAREKEVYWNGEKLVVSADVSSAGMPDSVTAGIDGTDITTELEYRDGAWYGELFDPSMRELWQGMGPQKVRIWFRVSADGQTASAEEEIVIDDMVQYWVMHRKE